MLKPISKELWLVLSKGKKYSLFCDMRIFIDCIDYLMENKIYRVQVI